MNLRLSLRACTVLCAFPFAVTAQQPMLRLTQHDYPRQAATGVFGWQIQGRANDLFVLLADFDAGPSLLFGQSFDLGFTPAAVPLAVGQLSSIGVHTGSLQFSPAALPAGTAVFAQFGGWDSSVGLGSLLVGNGESAIAHDGAAAVVFDFAPGMIPMAGHFDRAVQNRLQALPPVRRTVRPLPPSAVPFLTPSHLQSLHPSGSRFQVAFRPEDLLGVGVPETLTAVRWRPLFGAVATETFPQFEWRAAHTDRHPDYTIDPWSALPVAPNSGLLVTFAQNPRPGTAVVCFAGSYVVRPQDVLPSGYLPFPLPQQPFVYDGQSPLLLETLCWPTPVGGAPRNQQVIQLLVMSSSQPYGWVAAVAGRDGQPFPLVPTTAVQGTGASVLPDWELEFLRTQSVAETLWMSSGVLSPDYQPPHLAASTPPGTSVALEFRGADDSLGGGATAWSASQDVADGKFALQVRVRLEANAVTLAVPWIDTLVVPVR